MTNTSQMNLLHRCKTIIKLGLPMSSSGIINFLANFFAMLFVAKLGKVELAAAALASATFWMLTTFGTACAYAVSILIGRQHQDNNFKQIRCIILNGIYIAIFLSIPLAILLWNAGDILLLMKQDPNLIKITIPYFHYSAIVIFIFILNNTLVQFLVGINRPRISLISTSIRFPFTVLLSYVFILGKWGFPHYGLAGIPISTIIITTVNILCIIAYLMYAKGVKDIELFSHGIQFDLKQCFAILKLGLPIGFQFSAEIGAMTIVTYFLGYFGVAALAASQIVGQYSLLIVMMTLGFTQAISILVNRHTKTTTVYDWLNAALLPLGVFFALVWIAYLGFPNLLTHIFLNMHQPQHAEIAQLTRYFFAIGAVILTIDCLRNLLAGALRGLHHSKTPMVYGVIALWLISLPISALAGFVFPGGPIWLRIGFVTGFIVATWWSWQKLQSLTIGLEHNFR